MKKFASLLLSISLFVGYSPIHSAPAAGLLPQTTVETTIQATAQPTPQPAPEAALTSAEIEAWALGCSAILAARNASVAGSIYDPYLFGMLPNDAAGKRVATYSLSGSWNCDDREKLTATILRMTDSGHNARFAEAYNMMSFLTDELYAALLEGATGTDRYMLELTKSIGDKWGDKQIKAWDWFRMLHLGGWGYIAGYLKLEEAYEYMTPVIERLRATFSSWDEAVENYMDGYAWWSQTDVSESNTEYKYRLRTYEKLKDDKALFNPSVWGSGFSLASDQSDSGAKYYTFDDNGDGTCTITGYKWVLQTRDPVIHETINGLTVTAIADRAFSQCSQIVGILTIPDGVTTIGERSFWGCDGLTGVNLPDSLTSIGDEAFASCYGLADVTLPDSLTGIGNLAFEGCGLTRVTLPSSVTSIGLNPFRNCPLFSDINVASGNPVYEHIDGVLFDKQQKILVSYPGARGGSYTVPNDTLRIGDQAFAWCFGLTNVNIPDGVTSIGEGAFGFCTGLTGMTLPDSVTSIGDGAFEACTGLTGVTLPSSITSIGSSVFQLCSGLTHVTIPEGVTSIGNSAFWECSGLTNMIIPDGVMSIGEFAFWECRGLTSVTIGGGVTSIGDCAFLGCSGLTRVTLPGSVTSIGYGVFDDSVSVIISATEPASQEALTPGEIEAWAIGCSAILAESNGEPFDPYQFGALPHGSASAAFASGFLAKGEWKCKNREELIEAILRTINYSHSTQFAKAYDIVSSLTDAEYEDLLKGSSSLDGLQLSLIKRIGDKWGDKQIKAWDCFRAAHLPGWGYIAGYLEREEAHEYLLLIIDQLRATFSSWDEAVDNYLDGYVWWTCTDISQPNTEYKRRLAIYKSLKGDTRLFNPTLWEPKISTGDIPADPADDFRFEDHGDGTCAITGYEGSVSGQLILPEAINGLTVSAIGDHAFSGYSGFTGGLIIPDSVTAIGDSAFSGCSGFIGSLIIPDSVATIGASAFSECSGFTGGLILPDGVTTIGERAFSKCDNLRSVTLPDSLTSIGSFAFERCYSLADGVTIPAGVTSIGLNPFCNCPLLADIIVSSDNPVYEHRDGVLFDKKQKILVSCPEARVGSYTIPGDVLRIGDHAFDFSGVTHVTIPDGVTSIGDEAFLFCTKLTAITIPGSVVSIGEGAFSGCDSLTSVTILDGVKGIGDRAFERCYSLTGGVTIPGSVMSIGEYAFAWCDKLADVTISEGVTGIGNRAFEFCSSLTSVSIPETVASIGDFAFYACDGLTNVTIPNSVTSISDSAFRGCSGLTGVTLPDGVTSIGDDAFSGCSGLTGVTLPDGITSIGYGAFAFCEALTGVIIPDSVTSIGDDAFEASYNVTLSVKEGSFAEQFAKDHDLAYVLIE